MPVSRAERLLAEAAASNGSDDDEAAPPWEPVEVPGGKARQAVANGTSEGPGGSGKRQRPAVDLEELGLAPIDWPTFFAIDPVGEDYCVEPILPRGRQAAIFCVAGLGKSLVAVDFAAAKATGRPVLGQPAQAPERCLPRPRDDA